MILIKTFFKPFLFIIYLAWLTMSSTSFEHGNERLKCCKFSKKTLSSSWWRFSPPSHVSEACHGRICEWKVDPWTKIVHRYFQTLQHIKINSYKACEDAKNEFSIANSLLISEWKIFWHQKICSVNTKMHCNIFLHPPPLGPLSLWVDFHCFIFQLISAHENWESAWPPQYG